MKNMSLNLITQTSGYANRDCTLERRLVQSSEKGESIVIKKILKTKLVDVNARDEFYTSAISIAAKEGHFEIVQMLIEEGADVNTFNSILVTPLHFASQNNHSEVVKLLVLAGANIKAKNKDGLRAIDFALYNSETREVLKDAEFGELPEIEEKCEVPFVPDFAIEGGQKKPKKKKGKKSGKGKKGGKKKGGKKKKK